jgi:steroid 5-alpha reductase family enzyme
MAALPPLPTTTLSDAVSFAKTVAPYISQQLTLAHVLPLIRLQVSPTEWYKSTNPFVSGLLFALLVSAITFVVSSINKNYSQVDRLWSILPVLYSAHYAVFARASSMADTKRTDMVATLVGLWGARLTFNYARKGGYSSGSEDYRWSYIMRTYNPSPAIWSIFNLVFISIIQNLLLFSLASPGYIFLLLPSHTPTNPWVDLILPQALVVILALEALSDQQQWSFQSAKAQWLKTGILPHRYVARDLERGFLMSGLWSWCRHPNFSCEQMFWLILYQWVCLVTDQLWCWAIAGPLFLVTLFFFSTRLTEKISAGKYPEYREYQQLVGRFVPKKAPMVLPIVVGDIKGGKQEVKKTR